MRPKPRNLPGQFTDADGMRFYPTLWVLAQVEFINFDAPTKDPPHISLACVAVHLEEDKVDEFEKESQSAAASKHKYGSCSCGLGRLAFYLYLCIFAFLFCVLS
jgi:hypothetical protein